MKKYSLYLLLLISLLFVGLNNVNAAVGDSATVTYHEVGTQRYSGKTWKYWDHTVTTNGASYRGVCIDPGLQYSRNSYIYRYFYKTETNAKQEESVSTYDIGMGYLADITSYGIPTNETAIIQSVSSRVYTLFFTEMSKLIKTGSKLNILKRNSFIPLYEDVCNQINKEDSDLIETALGTWNYNKLTNVVGKKGNVCDYYKKTLGTNIATRNQTFTINGVSRSYEYIKNQIYGYVKQALYRSTNFMIYGRSDIEISTTLLNDTEIGSIHTIKLNGFTTNTASAILSPSSIKCTNCGGLTPTLYIKNGDNYDVVPTAGIDLVKSKDTYANKNGEFTIKVSFGNKNNQACKIFKYDISIHGVDKTLVDGFYIHPTKSSNISQRYVVVTNSGEKDFVKSVTNNTCECREIERMCNIDHNQDACNIFKEQFNSTCIACKTVVNNVECSDDDETIRITEGVAVEDKKSCNNIQKNVKECIVGKNDISGNSYEATSIMNNNPYCNVYCTEDYEVEVPGLQTANSGRYIKLSANITGKKSCYTNNINKTQFEIDLEKAREDIIKYYNEFKEWSAAAAITSESYSESYSCRCTTSEDGTRSCDTCHRTKYRKSWPWDEYVLNNLPNTTSKTDSYDSRTNRDSEHKKLKTQAESNLKDAITNYNNIIKQYNSCGATVKQNKISGANSTLWDLNYKFNPEVSFTYEDKYFDIVKDLDLTGSPKVNNDKRIRACVGEANSDYSNCNSAVGTNEKRMFTCYKSGSKYECDFVSVNVINATYVYQIQSAEASFRLPTQFYTVYPSGKVVNKKIANSTPLKNALPISLGVKAGVYDYTLNVSNLGEYYADKDERLGRIWGSKNSTVVRALRDSESCSDKGAVSAGGNGTYTCAYKVNCPECIVTGEGKWENPCPECPVIGSLYHNNQVNFLYRTITSKDINPNDRKLGANWNSGNNINDISTTTEMKAFNTKKEIIANGENIYDDDNEIVMSVKMTQSMLRDIREYNKSNQNNGGYLNDSLKCYDYTEEGTTYNNIYCYSTFLDTMVGKYGKDNIKFSKNRIVANDATDADANDDVRKNTENQCNNGKDCYWTNWTDTIKNSKFTISTKFVNYLDGVGPSYR